METLVQILSGKYMINPIPTYQAMRCSARKANGEDCQICSDVCPQGIYPVGKRKRPDWTQCLKCGICAANCPDRCLTFPAARVDNYLMALAKTGEMGIGCADDDSVMTLTVSCLAAISWEQMAIAALNKGLVISLKACEDCPRENFRQLIDQNIEQLRFFLGDELFAKRVRILHKGDQYTPVDEGMSRRELFSFFKSLPLDRALNLMPDLSDTKDNGLFYRAMLKEEVQRYNEKLEAAQRAKFRIKLPVFNENCFNCASCVRTCPQKALKITTPEGKLLAGAEDSHLLVTVESWRCVSCGICQRTCRYEGISGMGTMKMSTLGRVALKKLEIHHCADCGKPRHKDAEDGLCSSCAARRRANRLAEERKAKTEAMRAQREAEKAAKLAAEEAAKAEAEKAAAEAAAEAADGAAPAQAVPAEA